MELRNSKKSLRKFEKKSSKKRICDRIFFFNFARLKICEILPIASNLSQTLLTIGIQEKTGKNMNI
jgi:hypothetical protein